MAEKQCTRCGIIQPLSDYWMRHDRGKHYERCKKCMKAAHADWASRNRGKMTAYFRRWADKDPQHTRAVYREIKRRQRSDPKKRAIGALRTAVYISLKGIRKRRPTFELLGYSREQLLTHLERQFTKDMSWSNYGRWHIDHIVPLSSFDPDDVRGAWALSNLRPLWQRDNVAKKDRRTHLL